MNNHANFGTKLFSNFRSLLKLSLYCLLIFIWGCEKTKAKLKINGIDDSVYSELDYTKSVLDSTLINAFFIANRTFQNVREPLVDFYKRRAFQYAWFNQDGLIDATFTFYSQLQLFSDDFGDKSLINPKLDSLLVLFHSDEEQLRNDKSSVLNLELLLTASFFQYSDKVYGGTTKNTLDLEWFIPRKKKNYQVQLDSLVSATSSQLYEPQNQYYKPLKAKLSEYRLIEKKGGLPKINCAKKIILLGDEDSCLINVKKYLLLTGDLKSADSSATFDDSLQMAVLRFQHRMGLKETGKINQETIVELSQPIEFRIKQMMVNLERLRWIPEVLENDYLLVNIPAYKLHIFESGKHHWVTNVVVGQQVKQTAIFKGNISQIILNPYWGIPKSIVVNEILPKIKRNRHYLSQNNIEIINGNYRQKPGKKNALGDIKFLFPNHFNIYLHDTPSKRLFGETNRAFSHGCIRVENPKVVALWLLRKNTDWNEQKMVKILKTDTETSINLKPTVPIYIAYFTAWVESNGELNFRNDLYNLDDKLAKEIFALNDK